MKAAVTLPPLPGTAATLLNDGGSFRYASGTPGAGEGMMAIRRCGNGARGCGSAPRRGRRAGGGRGRGARACASGRRGGRRCGRSRGGRSGGACRRAAAPPSAARSRARRLTMCDRVSVWVAFRIVVPPFASPQHHFRSLAALSLASRHLRFRTYPRRRPAGLADELRAGPAAPGRLRPAHVLVEEADQRLHGQSPQVISRMLHRRQRGRRERRRFDAVEADHRHLLGHADARLIKRPQRSDRDEVVEAEDRRRSRHHARQDVPHHRVPARVRRRPRDVHGRDKGHARLRQRAPIAAVAVGGVRLPLPFEFFGGRVGQVGDPAVAESGEMRGRDVRARLIVDADGRDGRIDAVVDD